MKNKLEKSRKQPTFKKLETLKIFQGLSKESFEELQNKSTLLNVKTNYIVELVKPNEEKGSFSNYVYIIVDGIFSIFLEMSLATDCKFFAAWRGKDQILGEMGNHPDHILPSSKVEIKAITESQLLEIEYTDFTELADKHPIIYKNTISLLTKKVEDHCNLMEILRASSGEPRAAFVFDYLIKALGTKKTEAGLQINGYIPQDVIGSIIGVKRPAVNRRLKPLKDKGIIDYPENTSTQYTITDLPALEQIIKNETDKLIKDSKKEANRGFR